MDWKLWFAKIAYPIRAFGNLFSLVIGIAGGVIGLAGNFTEDKQIATIIQSATLAFVAFISFSLLGYREIVFSRRRKIAQATTFQLSASERIRDLDYILSQNLENTPENAEDIGRILSQARRSLENILDDYARLYSLVTSTRCRVCIKAISEQNGRFYVFALARDNLSMRENKKHDQARATSRLDMLENNSDFLKLWDPHKNDEGYFFSNNLPKMEGYSSSSINYWSNIEGDPNRPRPEKWLLPYSSTIVWPIRQEADEALGVPQDVCVGFLAVDSPSRGAFAERWDVQVW